MGQKFYCQISGILFTFVAAFHLARIVFNLPLVVGDYTVPMPVTVLGVAIPASLAVWAFRIAGSADSS